MQELLGEPLKSLSLGELKLLKFRFRRRFAFSDRLIALAHKRDEALMPLSGFTTDEKKSLLTLLVPTDLKVEDVAEETWDIRQDKIVNEIFTSRFENTPVESLRGLLDGTKGVPSGMASTTDALKGLRGTLETRINELQGITKQLDRRITFCTNMQKKVERDRDSEGNTTTPKATKPGANNYETTGM